MAPQDAILSSLMQTRLWSWPHFLLFAVEAGSFSLVTFSVKLTLESDACKAALEQIYKLCSVKVFQWRLDELVHIRRVKLYDLYMTLMTLFFIPVLAAFDLKWNTHDKLRMLTVSFYLRLFTSSSDEDLGLSPSRIRPLFLGGNKVIGRVKINFSQSFLVALVSNVLGFRETLDVLQF